MKKVYLNSRYVEFKNAKIHIEDRGLQFSDSVYEVVPFYKFKLIDLNFHLNRLKYSLKELKINFIVNENKLKKIFIKLIKLSKYNSGVVYLQITNFTTDPTYISQIIKLSRHHP